ncbi:MAG: HAMP domain-containing histidine kinase [Melioribacteraceae bacterium]|nr:HAMP domain-containing histidine kinase [Melioribacteraceae bacterium]MCF8356001.1 HAMP domain-containing histidine kinase [Melioribacteraceae bacterium]MCF8419590.1 HAMP domain-containing histidine kinase [Melioribacteraceae bacterium]
MMEELVAAKESAEIADKLKSEFLAQMSHEIRTPIHVILSYIGLIKSGMNLMSSDEVQSSFISIDSASKRIMRTIDLILNMAQIQTHSYEASFQYHDICNDIITKLDSEFSELAKQKGLYFRINNQCSKCKIEVDEYSVMQIFSNLIHNAIKYTDEGGVTVEIETNDELLIVRVIDTGIGMSKSYIKNLFTPFSQEEQGYSRKYEGNGLGLALVKSYCDINNAKIEIESEKGKGSIFTVTFYKS